MKNAPGYTYQPEMTHQDHPHLGDEPASQVPCEGQRDQLDQLAWRGREHRYPQQRDGSEDGDLQQSPTCRRPRSTDPQDRGPGGLRTRDEVWREDVPDFDALEEVVSLERVQSRGRWGVPLVDRRGRRRAIVVRVVRDMMLG